MGPFTPVISPALGPIQNFAFTIPLGWPLGDSVLTLGHVFDTNVSRMSYAE